MTIGFQASMALSMASGAIVGFIVLIIRMRMTDARWRHCLAALREDPESLWWVIFYDALAAGVTAVVFASFGITHPNSLVMAFHSSQALGWLVVGGFAPIASLGTSVFVTGVQVRARSAKELTSGRSIAQLLHREKFDELRKSSSRRLIDGAYEHWRRTELNYERLLHANARDRLRNANLSFDSLLKEAERLASARNQRLPSGIAKLQKRRAEWVTGVDPGEDTLQLVEALIDSGFAPAVALCCEMPARRRGG